MMIYGLIGYPLEHSFSYKYFTEKFKTEELKNVKYHNFPIKEVKEFTNLIESQTELLGLSVTSPYKEKVIPYLDELDNSAKQIGAVNCIRIFRKKGERKLVGYNTDIFGFTKSLIPYLNKDINSALILGTGGAAKAVEQALLNLGISSTFVSRKEQKGKCISYDTVNKQNINENLLIINATPLGMYPNIDDCPDIPYNAIGKYHVCYDLIYNPAQTLFLQKAKKQGASISNGMKMLVYQAEKAWEYFNM